jgi:hypothetical protein
MLHSKKASLLLLGVTSLLCSRALFWFFNDPEGPNLLIVTVTALIVYVPSLAAYAFKFSGPKKFLLALFIQILIVTVLYLFLN